jgi:hypothetical protein
MVASADKVERANAGSVSWRPSSVDQVASVYSHQFGEARLDLSEVDFQGQRVEIRADISFGDLRIFVPPNVDTTVITNVSFGDAEVFNRSSNGAGLEQEQTDTGEDGPGGGELLIILDVKMAHAEVIR